MRLLPNETVVLPAYAPTPPLFLNSVEFDARMSDALPPP